MQRRALLILGLASALPLLNSGGGHGRLRLLALYSGVSICTFVNEFLFVYIGRCDSKLLTRHIRPSMQRAGLGLSLLYEVHIS